MSTRIGKKREFAKVIAEYIKKKIELIEIQQKKRKGRTTRRCM